MNLEEIDTRCINYLRQSQKPIVSVSTLFEHCTRGDEGIGLDLKAFTGFLRQHGEIHFIPGPADEEEVAQETLANVGLDMGPRVMLASRAPTVKDLYLMMGEQLNVMTESLEKAAADAAADPEKRAALDAALERAAELREKMRHMRGGKDQQ